MSVELACMMRRRVAMCRPPAQYSFIFETSAFVVRKAMVCTCNEMRLADHGPR